MLNLVNPGIVQHNQKKFEEVIQKLGMDNSIAFLEFIKGKPARYWLSIFGKMEIEMAEMPFEKLN